MEDQIIQLSETKVKIDIKRAMIDGSYFEDISAKNIKIADANLSDLEIENAQLGGAYFHNIGMPPKGHPLYDPSANQKPLKFENCALIGSTISNCNLSGVNIDKCELKGMRINGILVEELLNAYHK
jgi:uncharacterized protein YjbI with pentapeptide repeats